MAELTHIHVSNGAGWKLALHRCLDREAFVPGRRPLLIIPGYGMNSFIFRYHPSGPSMMESLAARGFEVWSVDLRAQGESRAENGGRGDYCLEDIACVDVPAAVEGVLAHSRTGASQVDAIGCSLGGTYLYAYAACVAEHRLGALVAMGAPLVWESVHPALGLAFRSERLAGWLRLSNVRGLARKVFPLLVKLPWIVNIYMHPQHVDVSDTDTLVETVEDPNPILNREISVWIRERRLMVRGTDVAEALRWVDLPLLAVIANADGIVPVDTALSGYERIGSGRKDILWVGDDDTPFAHADLFVSRHAQERVFDPLARWLLAVE